MPVQVDKSDRTELKSHFVRNAIPTEGHFANLIDAMINQRDDGIAKLPDSPLSIEATGAQSNAMDLYESFDDDSPSWSISLRSRPDSHKRETVPGFAVNDSSGQPRLFIDAESGALGVATTSTGDDALTVAESMRILATSNPIRFTSKWSGFPDGVRNQAEICNDIDSHKTLMIVGNRSAGLAGGMGRRVSVWDRLEVNGTLLVTHQEDWKAPKFADKWGNFGADYAPAGFMKDSLGFVHLRGMVKDGATGRNTWVFTLPAGYRPAMRAVFSQEHALNEFPARVDIAADGKVIAMVAESLWLSLEGISFRAA